MSDQTVNICEGILKDSDAHTLNPGDYEHNEDFTFTICPVGVNTITLTFSSFCTELDYDLMRFFDGPDTTYPLINNTAYSGLIPPPPITSNGCLTVHFKSDANITCSGWEASWLAEVQVPVPPNITIIPAAPTCSTSVLTLNLDQKVNCDSVLSGAFSLSGPIGQTISSVPVNCINDSTDVIELTFSPGLDKSGLYQIEFTTYFLDPCDSLWKITATQSFSINDCPLELEIIAADTLICPGTCTQILAIVEGGDPQTYTFNWSGGLPNSAGPHLVCPVANTTYSLTVDDAGPATPVSDAINISLLPPPQTQNDTTVCEQDPSFLLSASPPGGYWIGPGVADSLIGRFRPWQANDGTHKIYYYGPNGCRDSMNITVKPMYAGSDEAACPGAAPFFVSGFDPPGGTWSGPNIQSNGLFDPSAPGSYDVVYTHSNGCSDTKTINVDNITILENDTVCESVFPFNLVFSPYGGTWAGNGITSTKNGTFDPNLAGTGPHELIYTLQGCVDTMEMFVREIDAGKSFIACPDQAPIILPAATPPGGLWSGIGITDPVAGVFDPGINGGDYDDTLLYTVNGCVDTVVVNIRQTEIRGHWYYGDTIPLCSGNYDYSLFQSNSGRYPGGGSWSGNGITTAGDPGIFNPAFAGPGFHTLLYELNTCTDNLTMYVFPEAVITDTIICVDAGPFALTADPPGGIWQGPGIIDTLNGIFDPQTAGIDTHYIFYTQPSGCVDVSPPIIVIPKPVVSLDSLDNIYCLLDTTINVVVAPPGGILAGNGITGLTFNPSHAGPGQHLITYTHGEGNCQQIVNHFVNVNDSLLLSVSAADDSICRDDLVMITAAASGGLEGNYSFSWDQGLGNSFQQLVSPESTTTYTVTLTDGCSSPAVKQITVVVADTFAVTFNTSDIQCYGENGFARINVAGPGDYSYVWHTQPPSTSDSITGPVAASYQVTITDNVSGCTDEKEVKIPGYPMVIANFAPNPLECTSSLEPEITMIDQSTGANQGIWTFGDGSSNTYIPGRHYAHEYADTGTYTVTLVISNDAGCSDSLSKTVCVFQDIRFILPTAFTPNNDGLNDVFRPTIEGIASLEMKIFNRWGELIFLTSDTQSGWDGTAHGKPVPQGVYVYLINYVPMTQDPSFPFERRGTILVTY